MAPSVFPGDSIIIQKMAYGLRTPGPGTLLIQWSSPKVGDIVVLNNVKKTSIILLRKIVALPGESVRVDKTTVSVLRNRRWLPIHWPNNTSATDTSATDTSVTDTSVVDTSVVDIPITILGKGEYFALSNKRLGGPDSRDFGPIRLRNIVGRASHIWIPSSEKKLYNGKERKARHFLERLK